MEDHQWHPVWSEAKKVAAEGSEERSRPKALMGLASRVRLRGARLI